LIHNARHGVFHDGDEIVGHIETSVAAIRGTLAPPDNGPKSSAGLTE
jgi:hypothetical protein